MSTDNLEIARRIFQAFDPRPLRSSEQNLYVDLDSARGEKDLVGNLSKGILFSRRPTTQLVAGHNGSGKSTELGRLKKFLEDEKYFVVYFEAADEIDRDDVDFLEILVAVVKQVLVQLKVQFGISLHPNYFADRFQRLRELLATEVKFDTLELEAGMTTFGISLKDSPSHRNRVRSLLESDTGNWLHAANSVLRDATQKVTERGLKGLVIIVDDLDKMDAQRPEGSRLDKAEQLFVTRAPQLVGFDCHMIYTMPVTLSRQLTEQRLRKLYDGEIPVVAMTKLYTDPPESERFPKGWGAFRDIIDRRLVANELIETDVFGRGARDELIRISGGQPTALMSYIQTACKSGTPISKRVVQQVASGERRSYERQFVREHFPILHEVRQNGRFTPAEEQSARFDELLLSRAILQYVNDFEWYALNPVIADLDS